MRKSLWYSLLGIIAVAVLALAGTLALGNKPLLGLDLQGGASVVLQPQGKVDSGILNQAISIIRKRVDGLGVAEPNISRQGNNVVIELPGIKDPARALQVVGQTAQLYFRPVLCTTGSGTSIQSIPFPPYAAPTTTTPGATTTTTPGATTTTTPGATTTTAPNATTTKPGSTTPSSVGLGAGGGRALGSALGAVAPAAAPAASGQPAQTPTPTPTPAAPTPATPAAPGTAVPGTAPATAAGGAAAPGLSSADCQLATSNVGSALPTSTPAEDVPPATVLLPGADKNGNADPNGPRYLLGPAQLTGKVVATATALPPDLSVSEPNWYVQVNFTGSGGPAFDKLAQANYQKIVAIALDGVVESAPVIQQQTFNGKAVINGSTFTETQAKNLALELRYGSLPVQFQAQSIQSVSATIGKDSLRAGLIAGAIGLLLVLCYMLFYYRGLGLVVVLGLGVSGMLLYAIISALSQSSLKLSLSLAGATGIIVSVGVTADSYIVYFERLKDEIRSGRSVRSSVDRGFARAYRTIVAADLVSVMAAVILWLFTVGSVRGFAFFLGLATLLDLFTAFFFTRPMVALLGRNRLFTEARVFGVARGLAATPTGGAQ
ncbi:MAG: protein translocase subunit SecD [Actinomycetota bacterium]|nr:protein translocase subunit SecD [Actinomycetota bacterium]